MKRGASAARWSGLGLGLALALALSAGGALSQTAALLPNGVQQYSDQNGSPLAGGSVCFYQPGTLTPKTTWLDPFQQTANATPCVGLNAAGEAIVYGSGQYRQRVLDQNGNLVWDQLTYGTVLPATGAYITGPSISTVGNVPGFTNTTGTAVGNTYGVGTAANDLVQLTSAGALPAVSAVNLTNLPTTILRDYIAGLVLSNDSTAPNTVLDIAAGQTVDSTNSVYVTLGSFTKSIAGPWASGAGANGMGTGLTVQNSTWYHVFVIVNAGITDVYFDTSVTAANAPAGTTAFRRVGSFETNGSAQIIAFKQDGDLFEWATPTVDYSTSDPGTSAVTVTLNVPLGVLVTAIENVVGGNFYTYLSDLATNDLAPSNTAAPLAVNGSAGGGTIATQVQVHTNVASQIRLRISSSGGGQTPYLATTGWIDHRGKDN